LSLLNRDKEDKLIWKFNIKGSYTVNSAYIYAMETLVDNKEYKIPGEWTAMWKLKIPQKKKSYGEHYEECFQHVHIFKIRVCRFQIAALFVKQIMRIIGMSLLGAKRQNPLGKRPDCGN
jgi:hypothetical protein